MVPGSATAGFLGPDAFLKGPVFDGDPPSAPGPLSETTSKVIACSSTTPLLSHQLSLESAPTMLNVFEDFSTIDMKCNSSTVEYVSKVQADTEQWERLNDLYICSPI